MGIWDDFSLADEMAKIDMLGTGRVICENLRLPIPLISRVCRESAKISEVCEIVRCLPSSLSDLARSHEGLKEDVHQIPFLGRGCLFVAEMALSSYPGERIHYTLNSLN